MITLVAPGCTRLNSAFGAGEAAEGTTGSADGTSLPTSPTAAGTSTSDSDPDDGNPTSGAGTTEQSGETDATAACVEASRPCDLYVDAGCSDGEQCRPWSSQGEQGVGCVTRPDQAPLQPGQDCEHLCDGEIGVDRCSASTICDPHADEPVCVPLCGPQGSCAVGFCEPHEGYGICRINCDLLLQNCPEGSACYPDKGAPTCQSQGTGEPGTSCTVVNKCAPGSICVSNEVVTCPTRSCCAELCDLGGGDCDALDECTPLFDGAKVGVCVAP